jgi:FAD/FMN-containing dehydrogenase
VRDPEQETRGMSDAPFVQSLVDFLGADAVWHKPDDVEPWLSDWRGLYRGAAQAVVRPRHVEQVARCVELCAASGVPITLRGGNTGLCGGATPDSNARNVILSLDRMIAIRSIDTVANTMIAEAGCILGNLRRAADEAGRLLPLSLAAEDSSQIGGNLSTNAGGVNVLRYGMARDLTLGVEAVLPNGEIFRGLRELRKDNTGYDLKQLLIGSEGTLGVITAVALRLSPRMNVRSVALIALASAGDALRFFERAYGECGPRLQAFEFFTGACLELVLQHAHGVQSPFATNYPAYVLMELADSRDEEALTATLEAVVGDGLEQELCLDAVVSSSLSQLQNLWRLREEISEALRADGPHLKHDISLPIAAIPQFMDKTIARVNQQCAGVRPFIFGHLGDGNLHYNLVRPNDAPLDWSTHDGKAVTETVLESVVEYGGSISAEHGIGQLKRDAFLKYKSPLELQLMRQLKNLFDPLNILNPGKLL